MHILLSTDEAVADGQMQFLFLCMCNIIWGFWVSQSLMKCHQIVKLKKRKKNKTTYIVSQN